MKTLLLLLAALSAVNGAAMLAGPDQWYRITPGVAATGPFNAHFIADIGLAFMAAGAALALATCRPAERASLLAVAAIFLTGHAALHLLELAHHGGNWPRDLALIVAPGLLPAAFLAVAVKRAQS